MLERQKERRENPPYRVSVSPRTLRLIWQAGDQSKNLFEAQRTWGRTSALRYGVRLLA